MTKPDAPRKEDRAAAWTTESAQRSRHEWQGPLTVFAFGVAALLALFSEAVLSGVRTWIGSTAYNHSFLIIPISVYLAHARRTQLVRLTPEANYWGLTVIAVLALVWFLGDTTGLLFVQQLTVVAMVQALFFTIFGWRIAHALAFPLFYLFFMVPFGQFMVAPLQDFTAVFVVRGLQMIGIPVFLDGIFISIPNGNFLVAEACAGVRFLIATIALGVLGMNLFYRVWWKRVVFLGLALLVPIVANGIRAFGIVYIAHVTDNEVAVGVDHFVYGWIFFAFVTAVLLAIGASFRDHRVESPSAEAPAAPVDTSFVTWNARPFYLAGLASILVIAVAPAFSAYLNSRLEGRMVPILPKPVVGQGWRLIDRPTDTWRPRFDGADAEMTLHYEAGDKTVIFYTAFYTHQRLKSEIVNQMNRFDDDRIWTRAGSGRTEAVLDNRPVATAYTRLVSRSAGRLVWHWYWVDEEFTADPLRAKLLQARARLFGGTEAAAVVAVATNYQDRPAEAAAVLKAFMEFLSPLGPALEKSAAAIRMAP